MNPTSAGQDPIQESQPEAPAETKPKGLTYEVARVQYELVGRRDTVHLDFAVAFAVEIGARVELSDWTGRYRVYASSEQYEKIQEWIEFQKLVGAKLQPELAPACPTVKHRRALERPPVRTVEIHGKNDAGARLVARAIDVGLVVHGVGINRYEATGPTRLIVAWIQLAWQVSEADALSKLHLTAEQVLEEDRAQPTPVEVAVSLPIREITSVIERTAQGDIRTVTQTERTVS